MGRKSKKTNKDDTKICSEGKGGESEEDFEKSNKKCLSKASNVNGLKLR